MTNGIEQAVPLPPIRSKTPWEDRQHPGAASRFLGTVRSVLWNPTRFFRELDVERIGGAVSFALVALLVPLAIQMIAAYAMMRSPQPVWPFSRIPRGRAGDPDVLGRLAFLAPVIAMFFAAYLAMFYQAATAIASRRRPALLATIRATCFGFAPMVVAVVPVVGLFIGLLWSLALHAIALREVHGLGRVQAALVVAMPVLVIACTSPIRDSWWPILYASFQTRALS